MAATAGVDELYPLGIIGHSRGGHTAVLAAAEIDDISCLVAWAPVANLTDSWTDAMKETWKSGGDVVIQNARTGEALPIGPQLFIPIVVPRLKTGLTPWNVFVSSTSRYWRFMPQMGRNRST